MSDRERFLAERRNGVGGSDVDDVFSLPPYGCARKLWYEKTGTTPDFELSNDAILRGVALEPLIRDIFRKKTGLLVEEVQEAFLDAHGDPMLVHVDGLVMQDGSVGVLEIKAPGREGYQAVKRDGMPKGYILQLQHGMTVTGARFGFFIVHCADYWSKPLIWRVEEDREMQEMIRQGCRDFWKAVEAHQEPPRLDASDPRCKKCQFRATCQGEYLDALLEAAPEVERDPSIAGLLAELLDAKSEEKAAGEVVDYLEAQVKAALGDRQVVDAPGARVYYKAGERVTPYSADAIKTWRDKLLEKVPSLPSELQDIVIQILTPRVTKTRTLRVYARGK